MEYRRHLHSEIWHCSRDCSHWPRDFSFIVLDKLRPEHEICSECSAFVSMTSASQCAPVKDPDKQCPPESQEIFRGRDMPYPVSTDVQGIALGATQCIWDADLGDILACSFNHSRYERRRHRT